MWKTVSFFIAIKVRLLGMFPDKVISDMAMGIDTKLFSSPFRSLIFTDSFLPLTDLQSSTDRQQMKMPSSKESTKQSESHGLMGNYFKFKCLLNCCVNGRNVCRICLEVLKFLDCVL